jgi:hypothetical protein
MLSISVSFTTSLSTRSIFFYLLKELLVKRCYPSFLTFHNLMVFISFVRINLNNENRIKSGSKCRICIQALLFAVSDRQSIIIYHHYTFINIKWCTTFQSKKFYHWAMLKIFDFLWVFEMLQKTLPSNHSDLALAFVQFWKYYMFILVEG